MRLWGGATVVALIAAAVAALSANAAAPGFTLVEGGNALFPDRAYVIATDQKRRLTSADLAVAENGKRISGVTVDNGAQGIGTVLLIDASNSMKGSIGEAMAAARTFAARNPGTPLSVVTFNSRPRVVLPFTADKRAITRRSPTALLSPRARTSGTPSVPLKLRSGGRVSERDASCSSPTATMSDQARRRSR